MKDQTSKRRRRSYKLTVEVPPDVYHRLQELADKHGKTVEEEAVDKLRFATGSYVV